MGNCLNCGLPVSNISNRCYICRKAKDTALSDYKCQERAEMYRAGFSVLMEYWDSISDEEKPKVNRRLEVLGL